MPEFITESVINGTLSISVMLLCTGCSLLFGFAAAFVYMYKNKYSKSLAVALVLIPATVQIIIMLVNGNIGAGVAVAGAFSLVRFRSIPGNARDIGSLFFAMAIGFVNGMGYLFYSFIFLLIIGAVNLTLTVTNFAGGEKDTRVLKITIPENLDYDGLFDDIFKEYTQNAGLNTVRSTNMGSLYELTYSVRLKAKSMPKAFIDELRCRNGNLNILISREQSLREEL